MAKEPKSLFRKLTQLFRSGPIVRRKIRALDTTTAMADKTKSSGTLLFQKSLSPTYASITSNAYNLSERLMRYQDFQEMEYTPEIAAALDIYADETCLTKESIVSTPYGKYTIEELLKMNGAMTPLTKGCDNIPEGKFPVYCYDNVNKRITIGFGHSVRQTGTQVPVVKVLLDNGDSIRCTPNHRFMLRNGSYVEAGNLIPGTSLMPFKLSSFTKNVNDYQYVYTMDKKKTKNGWRAQHAFNVEHLVRELKENEVVHHKDFVRTNNGIDNLQIMDRFEHASYHASLNNVNKFGKLNNKHANWMMENNPIKVSVPELHELDENKHLSIKEVALKFNTTYSVLQEWVRKYGFKNWEAYKSGEQTHIQQKMDRITSSLSLDEIKRNYVVGESKAQHVMKLGCTVNVFDKFLNRKLKKSWTELTFELGDKTRKTKGGRPKGSYSRSDVTYQDICNIMTPGSYLTQNEIAEKLNTRSGVIVNRITANGFDSFSSWQKSFHNHKVVSVTPDGLDDVYDLTVDEHHNFACNGVIVHNCAQDDKGRVLHVYSDNEKIKEILEDMFYDTLNVEFNMRSWVRNLPVHKDTMIPLLDGRNITIEALSKEIKEGKQNWVYSVQDKTQKLVPGKVVWCDLTRIDSELVRVTLDDNTHVDCTPDHEWVLRDGSRKRADELLPNDSLMPLYRSYHGPNEKVKGYEKVYDPSQNKQVYTHRIMPFHEWTYSDVGKVVHHVNFNRYDNSPTNLRVMTKDSHKELHSQLVNSYNSSDLHTLHNVQRRAASKKMWADLVKSKELKESMSIKFDNHCVDMILNQLDKIGKYVSPKVLGSALKTNDAFMTYFRLINKGTLRDLTKSLNSHAGMSSLLSKVGVTSYLNLIKERNEKIASTPWFKRAEKKSARMIGKIPAFKNHKVLSVEVLSNKSDVYCMEVQGQNGEHDRHNFMVLSSHLDGTTSTSGVCLSNCKYGDIFLYNDVSPDYGVVNAFPIPVNEIEREENYDRDDPFAVRYRWVTMGNRTLENWEVSHFRLLGNDMFLPYGSSVIEPARRIWRQLILIEDAMLVYRVVRAPERRVFYIDVANIPPENVQMYVEEQRKRLRTNQVVDNNTGRVDLRYNPMCISKDVSIKLHDGRVLRLGDLIKEWESGKQDQWVHSIDLENNRIVPGKVIWAGETRKNAALVRVHLDDGSYLDTTPDHKFMLRDGSYCEAKDLKTDQPLMPLYLKTSSKATGDYIEGYEKVYDPFKETYEYTHRINGEHSTLNSSTEVQGRNVVHHVDFNKKNNNPDNLLWMNYSDHRKYHAEHCDKTLNSPEQLEIRGKRLTIWNKSDDKIKRVRIANKKRNSIDAMSWYNTSELHKQHNVQRSNAMSNFWSDEEKSIKAKQHMTYVWDDKTFSYVQNIVKQNPNIKREQVQKELFENKEFTDLFFSKQTMKREKQKISYQSWMTEVYRRGYKNFTDFRKSLSEQTYLNHKVARIEFLDHTEDTGCITVEKYHNFAACGSTENGEKPNSYVYLHNSVDEDYIIPVRGGDSGTKIDTLAGGQNTAAVEDVAYIQKKLFAALKIPRAYLGYDELLCLTGDTRVPILGPNGVMTMENLVSTFSDKDRKEDLYVYSCDDKGKIVPGKVIDAWETKKVESYYEVTLDSGGKVKCTPNHPFMLRDGSYCRADELKPGQSLMPLYRKLSSKKEGGSDLIDGYEMILDNMTNEWKYTHKVVSDYMNSEKTDRITKQRVVHHIDFNKLNNEPSNLREMTWYDHRKLHAHNLQYTLLDPKVIAKREPIRIAALKAPKHREKKSIQMTAQHADQNSKMSQWVHGDKISEVSSAVMKKNWEDPAYRELKTKQNNELWTRPDYRDKLVGDNHWLSRKYEAYDINWLKEFSKQNSVTSIKQWRSDHVKSISHLSPIGIKRVTKLLCSNGFSSWRDFASRELGIVVPLRGPVRGSQQSKFNINDLKEFCVKHNVTSIGQWTKGHRNSIVGISPVSGTVIKRVLRENGFVNFNDFKKTLTYNHKVLSVNVIKLDEPVSVYDITVEGHHNFAICTPKRGDDNQQWYDDNDKKSSLCDMGAIFVHNSSKATLAQEDIRFSRTINVIQKTMLAELNKLAIIHLYANGFEDDDLQNFTLRLSNPSTVAQQQKLELWRAKFEIGGSLPENMGSTEFVQREVWGLSKEEIDQINQQRFSEKTINAQLEAITAESVNGGESDDMSGGGGGDDIFGDMGGDDSGGEEPADAGGGSEMEDLPPEENAGEEPEEEVENDVELLTSSEDFDDDEDFALKLSFEGDGQKPIKPVSQLKHSLYNRGRKRTHGASKTHMPDFAKMTASDNKSLNDPNDTNFLKALVSNPLGETRTRTRTMFNGLTPDIWSTLKNMTKSEKFVSANQNKVMTEAVDDSTFVLDIDSEDE
jgi:intein/homing endonuclease